MVAVNFYGVGFFGPLPRGHKKPCPPYLTVGAVQSEAVGQQGDNQQQHLGGRAQRGRQIFLVVELLSEPGKGAANVHFLEGQNTRPVDA